MSNLSNALFITAAGMGLVFGAILLLWGVMALLVRLTSERAAAPAPEEPEGVQDAQPEAQEEADLRLQAAAAAVAIALAEKDTATQPQIISLPLTATVSPWQGVMRARMLNKRGNIR
jgi:Na+-transporting methylmalonyl-CoA/oxaloacetate decarboxylase gamma subunit